jgi:hypothetical protein
MEVDEAPIEGDAAPFPREDAIMMIYGRHPSLQKCCMHDPSMGTPARCSQGWGRGNVRAWFFSCTLTYVNIYIYIHIFMDTMYTPKTKAGGEE